MTNVESMKNRFIDELQAHIILAGGIKYPEDVLRKMQLQELLALVYPNQIRLSVTRVDKRERNIFAE